MLTKKKHVGSAHAYKTVIDWNAVGGLVVLVVVGLALLGSAT